MMIKESTIKNIVKKHVINEMAGEQNVGSEYSFELKNRYYFPEDWGKTIDGASAEERLRHLIISLKTLKNKADSVGVDLSWKYEVIGQDEEGYDEYRLDVSVSQPDIKVKGYKFIGAVYPIAPPKETDATYALVCPSKEFKDNMDIIDKIKETTFKGTCDGCHRETVRGSYYMFIEEKTGQIKKFGGTCAKKYFGINISNAMSNLMAGLDHIGHDPYAIYDEDGFYIGRYENPSLGNDTYGRFDKELLAACMTIQKEGTDIKFKNSAYYNTYLSMFNQVAKSRKEYTENIKRFIKIEPDYVEMKKKSDKMLNELFENMFDFYSAYRPNSEFLEKVREYALILGGGAIQKKFLSKISPNVVPYVVSIYFKSKEKPEEPKRIEQFSGRRIFKVRITSIIDAKNSRDGSTYYKYTAETDDGYKLGWTASKKDENMYRGKEMKITAEYRNYMESKNINLIRNVEPYNGTDKDTSVSIEPYPEDGYRYKDEIFRFKILTGDHFIVVNEKGHEYYIKNFVEGYGYHTLPHTKWENWKTQFSLEEPVKITGTVASYEKNGRRFYRLLRPKIKTMQE